MSTRTVVIKYGGHAMDQDELNAAFADDMAFLQQRMRLVVVHGGGPQINALLGRLAIASHFEKGLRVTDADTMQAVEMVLCGEVNKRVVSRFLQHGARAAGVSGRDGGLLRARARWIRWTQPCFPACWMAVFCPWWRRWLPAPRGRP